MSQRLWQKMIEPTFKNSFRDIDFVSSQIGWAIGSHGYIVKTSDAGATWEESFVGIDKSLSRIHALNEDSCWIAGDDGYCFYTQDGGENWSAIILPSSEDLNDIFFANPTHGWVVGDKGTIFYTTDGINWKEPGDKAGITDNVYSVAFLNELQGYAGSKNTILRTVDGGNTWIRSEQINSGGIGYSKMDIRAFHIFNENEAIACGYGSPVGLQPSLILKTTDGGKNWTYSNNGDKTYGICYDLCFKDNQNGIAVGRQTGVGNIILTTNDGGLTWTKRNIFSGSSLKTVDITDDRIWVAGLANFIAYSEDWAGSWQLACDMPALGSLYTIETFGENYIWAAGSDGGFLRSTDGGKSWIPGWIISDNTSVTIFDLYFKDENMGWAVGMNRSVRKTTDGGETWQTIAFTPELSVWNQDIYFVDDMNGFIVGKDGSGTDVIYRSSDGGETWIQTLREQFYENLLKIDFANSQIGCVVSEDSLIIYTNDGGTSWLRAHHNMTEKLDINDIKYIDEECACAVGEKGTLLFSTDAGVHWTSKNTGIYLDFEAILFVNPDSGYIVGEDGYIAMTADGGNTWMLMDSIVDKDLKDIALDEKGNLWICGMSTTVLGPSIETKVFSELNHVLPKKAGISQNYPNPFNAQTIIEYQLPQAGHVRLDVYNLLGQKIVTLVDRMQRGGQFHVVWDGKDSTGRIMPSGVYFYRLKSINFIETKKMLVIH